MAKKSGSISRTVVWIILGLLIVGLAGFGTTSFTGRFDSIGTVGDSEIGTSAYARALQAEIRALEAQTGGPLTFQQAQEMGVQQRVLSQLVTTAALETEASALGISVGDERLAQDLRAIAAFRGPDGDFNRDAYAFALRNAGLTEAEFEADLRDESAATLLQGAVLAGIRLPDTYIDTLVAYAGERRDFTWAELGASALTTGIPEPTEADLQTWYDANIDRFTIPETKVITYVSLTPDMIVDSVEVDEQALRDLYEDRAEQYRQPERRLVERLVFANDEAAQAAAERLAAGEADFEALVEARGLALSDTDMGDVSAAELGAAADTVFAAEAGDVVGPAPSDLGPALYRVNGVLAAQETTFEEAQPTLRDELALDRARRVIEGQAQGFDDELAAGATLEELADQTELELGQIDWTGENAEGIAGYDIFREAAEAVQEGDFPEMAILADGGVFALRLDEIRAPAPQPFEDVRDEVVAGWEQDQRTEALVEEAETLRGRLAEGQTFEAAGLTPSTQTGLTRNAFGGQLPEALIERVFTMEPGAVAVLPGAGTAILVRLDAVNAADPESEQAQALSGLLGDQAAQDVAQDLFRALSADIQSRVRVVIDQDALNAVHANFQ